jgi:hypothetical protein
MTILLVLVTIPVVLVLLGYWDARRSGRIVDVDAQQRWPLADRERRANTLSAAGPGTSR